MDDTYSDPAKGTLPGQRSSVMNSATQLTWDDVQGIRLSFCSFYRNLCSMLEQRTPVWCNHATAQLFVGDFDGDGTDDLLCHDTETGRKWVDRANPTGLFNGNDWISPANGWCAHSTAQLLIADLNGDGRDDLLCHDRHDGEKWWTYASATGSFTGATSYANTSWCRMPGQEVHIGDFDGDGRDDLLCHDPVTGKKSIDYSADGIDGTDYATAANGWCAHGPEARLKVGKINGDNRDDLFCHDDITGEVWWTLANSAGKFTGGTEYRDFGVAPPSGYGRGPGNSWCEAASGYLADFDGDDRDDVLCFKPVENQAQAGIALAASPGGGTLVGQSMAFHPPFCNEQGDVLYVGDFDGPGRSDLLCHNTLFGTKDVWYF